MSTLRVQNIPEDLVARLEQSAAAHRRSLSAEAVALLEWALEAAEHTTTSTLASIRRRRSFGPSAAGAPESTHLLHNDRDR